MTLWKWSRTAATNGTADSTCPFPEGMNPGALNDGTRGMMAATAKYRDDIAGAIVTGGTSSAYSVATFQGYDSLAHLDGAMIAFTPHTGNALAPTLNVDGQGAKPLRYAPNGDLPTNTLIQGTPYVALYNNTDSAWYLQGGALVNPFSIPLGAGIEYWDTVAPNSAFAFPLGQALSRTTYAGLFLKWGTRYGSGDGSTTFNMPNKQGRISAMVEASASLLTSSYFGGNSTQLGAVGGNESHTLVATNLPPQTPSGTVGVSISSVNGGTSFFAGSSTTLLPAGTGSGAAILGSIPFIDATTWAHNTSFTGTAMPGQNSAPARTVPPTIITNYIIRII
ncbi:tail fiber protein [Tardiphaga sp. 841_E9_N1_2]|uniref:tail fiber protein n=1 Tax=Tardiphaga sp. 841_E9_N1_2 TaxID=3240762 RepID=UPI003F226FC7